VVFKLRFLMFWERGGGLKGEYPLREADSDTENKESKERNEKIGTEGEGICDGISP